MPELPEVESLRRFLAERIVGLTIERAEVAAFSALKTFDPPIESIVGRRVIGVGRRGKYLIVETGAPSADSAQGAPPGEAPVFVVVHLARGGWIRWQDELNTAKSKPGKGPLALRLGFSDGAGMNITEAGTEKRLAVWVVRRLEEIEMVATLGPDPLESGVTVRELGALLRSQKGQIKKVLTDQRVVAGVGNAYSDEALHEAKLSPFRQADKLTADEAQSLARAVVRILSEAVVRSGDVPVSGLKSEKKSGLRVHGRAGQLCPVCNDTVREVSFATKSLQYCPTCQTSGKPLADRRMSRLLK